MKAKELRIGNLITNKEGKVEKVFTLNDEWINGYDGNAGLIPDREEDFNGISLNKEWITNLGFINLIMSEHWIFPLVMEKDNFGWTLRISTANGSIICSSTIDYVHELQNLYFAITKKELVLRK